MASWALALNAGARPSGPPTISVTSSPSPCQDSSFARERHGGESAPRSSGITRRQRGGRAASMRGLGRHHRLHRLAAAARLGLDLDELQRSSRGMRAGELVEAGCTQAGMRWPTRR